MRAKWIVLGICLVLWTVGARADQRVEVMANSTDTPHEQLVEQGLEQAVALEIAEVLGEAVGPDRLRALVAHVRAQGEGLVAGYSDVTAVANATEGTLVLDVRTNRDAIHKRLRDLGVLYTADGPKPYVLALEGVDPSRTRRLGPLQDLSGLMPTGAAGPDVPVLRLAQEPPGAWTGTLSQGGWF